MSNELKGAFISAAVVALLFIAGTYTFELYREDITELIGERSAWSMAVYVLIFAASIVVAPISAAPFIGAGVQLWGVYLTTVLSVVGWTAGAMIAFSLARRFGHPLVDRIVPANLLDHIEAVISPRHVFWTIFFFRTVTPFDGVSYAFGLVPFIRPRTHFFATFFGLIPFCLAISYLGTLPPLYLLIGLIGATLLALAVGYELYRYLAHTENDSSVD